MTETVIVTEMGCDSMLTYRRCTEDDEQFELVCEDGSTKVTRSHFEDVLLDNIARRDDTIATLRAQLAGVREKVKALPTHPILPARSGRAFLTVELDKVLAALDGVA